MRDEGGIWEYVDAIIENRKRNNIYPFNKTSNMTTKEMSRQLRLLDTKYANIKKLVTDLGIEKEAADGITEILDAQCIVHRKQIVEGKAVFAVKQEDDLKDVLNSEVVWNASST